MYLEIDLKIAAIKYLCVMESPVDIPLANEFKLFAE